ncbi:type II toxin-antitoxin system HicB family antitoxin [Synechocystis sp. PCC 7509]|uniref:type II toxin-antitoxin system HicB family antitoxin n=1 Tax=Synechocystis sp. PCC 7509 TaxID=927677 RepID=UPI0002AD191B|nr:type II toxin-antitoxin system HicB family antitoxin [Synechocystis sp. PCC 7509]
MKIKAIVHSAEEGGYWAEVPELVGCITEGDTMEEVMANLKDAIVGWLDVADSRKIKYLPTNAAMAAMLDIGNGGDAIDSTDQIVEIAV